MQQIVRHTLYVFLGITVLTAVLSVAGLAYLWFLAPEETTLPFLGRLVTISILEIIAVIIVFAKRGVRYLPLTHANKNADQTNRFMHGFISVGSSVTIVSNRVAWLARAPDVVELIQERAKTGTHFEIITPQPVAESIREPLESAGVHFIVTGEGQPPKARFTLIDPDRSGATKLAIANGGHPNHEINEFSSTSGPHLIGMAKDIVRKSKEIANATPVE